MGRITYTKEQFTEAVKSSISVAEALGKLQLNGRNGCNYKTFHKYSKIWGVNSDHFLGQSHRKGSKGRLIFPDENKNIQSHSRKKRLIALGVKKHQCECCTLTEWMGKPIPISLHHEDGNKNNNALSNLKILCANCHALTPNFAGKNRGKYGRRGEICTRTDFTPQASETCVAAITPHA